jgi:lipid II:glycine glycyltransferase (peptidoglycan interpeptide bridge formation enzyme)
MRLEVQRSVWVEWSQWIEGFGGNIFHSPEWGETLRSDYAAPLFFRGLDHDGQCVAIALGIERWSSRPVIGCLLKRLDFETFPAVMANDAVRASQMISRLIDFAKTEGYRGITVQSQYAGTHVAGLDEMGLAVKPRVEFIVDLTRSEGELWKQLSTHHQRKIKKAGQQGLVLEECCRVEGMQELRRLQINSRDRRTERGEYFGLQDEAYYSQMGQRYFERNLGRLFLMRHEGRAVSAAFISMYAGRAFYVLGGSDAEGFELNAPALLFWEAFRRCRELGCREFNLGGVPALAANPESLVHGLYRFKAGFGGRQVSRVSGALENIRSACSALAHATKRSWLSKGLCAYEAKITSERESQKVSGF